MTGIKNHKCKEKTDKNKQKYKESNSGLVHGLFFARNYVGNSRNGFADKCCWSIENHTF